MMKKFLVFITTVALVSVILCASFVSAAEAPVNMLSADICSDYEKASAFLSNLAETDVNYDGMQGVLHIPVVENGDSYVWSLQQVPYSEYTVSVDVAIMDGSANFLFGVGENGGYPWTQLIFEPSFDDGILKFFHSKHTGSAWEFPGQQTGFTDMIFDGETFYNLTVEVTVDEIFVFFDGLEIGAMLDTSNFLEDLSYIGFRAGGGSSGYLIKNLAIYEGVGLELDPENPPVNNPTEAPTEASTEAPTEVPTEEPTVEATEEATEDSKVTQAPTQDEDSGNGWILPVVIIAVVVIAGAVVVVLVLKKKK